MIHQGAKRKSRVWNVTFCSKWKELLHWETQTIAMFRWIKFLPLFFDVETRIRINFWQRLIISRNLREKCLFRWIVQRPVWHPLVSLSPWIIACISAFILYSWFLILSIYFFCREWYNFLWKEFIWHESLCQANRSFWR